MKKCISTLACFVVFTFLAPLKGQTCTTFCLDHGDRPVFGRNYDWTVEDGLVIINKRGVTKASTLGRLAWTSKYGSATFNQYGREFPIGGMNEAGLVVESMVLLETEYPLSDTRPGIQRRPPRASVVGRRHRGRYQLLVHQLSYLNLLSPSSFPL